MSENKKEMNKILFANLIMMLSSSAMQQLGKLVNPATGKTELQLDGARMTIDMLEMLKEKSTGNRDAEEERMMKEILSMLQLNYVETANNKPTVEEKKEEASGKETETDKPKDAEKK